MSKVTLADLIRKDEDLESVDSQLSSGRSGSKSALQLLKERRMELQQADYEKKNKDSIPLHQQKDVDTSRASFGVSENEDADLQFTQQKINEQNPGNEATLGNRSGQLDEMGQSMDTKTVAARNFIDNTKANAKKGLGDFVSGWGDIFQVVGAGIGAATQQGDFSELMLDGNVISEAMQEYGGNMAKQNENYIPPEVQNAEFSAATFFNPEFWSTHGGQFLPQLTEILATVGAASLVKKGAEKVGQKLVKDILAESAEAMATKTAGVEAFEAGVKSGTKALSSNKSWFRKNILGEVATTTKGQYVGGEAINTLRGSGSGILGKTMTDSGNFTRGFGDLVQGVSGGAITNLTVSLRNAGEVFNTYKNVYEKDEDGNVIMGEDGQPKRMFTNEQLGEMASDTFTTNMQYMLADMMSWGMTYGKGWNYMGSYGSKLASGAGAAVSKVAPQLFTKLSMPIFGNAAKLGGKMLAEGMEEQVQESYEEWSKMKAYHDTHGSLEGYKGMPISQKYDMNSGWGPFSGGFVDFLKSKDSETLRAISFGLGAVSGGLFNASTLINKQADEVHKFQNRSENLKRIFEKGTDGKAWQDKFIHDQMAELVMDNKGGAFQDFVQTMYNENKINDDDVVRYGKLYNDIATQYDSIKNLKIAGKKAYMLNAANELHFQNKIAEATDSYQNSRQAILDIMETVPQEERTQSFSADIERKLKKEEDIFKAKITPLANMISKTKQNKTNLLLDKSAVPVDYDVAIQYDETGNADIQYVEKEMKQQSPSANEDLENGEDQNQQTDEQYDEMFKEGWKNVKEAGKTAKEYVKKILGFANNEEENNEQNTEEDATIAETNPDAGNDVQSEQEIEELNEIEKNRTEELKNVSSIPDEISLDPETQKQAVEAKKIESEQKIKEINDNYDQQVAEVKAKYSNPETKTNEQEITPSPKQEFKNPNVRESNDEIGITTKDKNEFKQKGTVGSNVITYLANKNNEGKKLTKSETEIYDAFKEDIDEASKTEIDYVEQQLNDPDLDPEVREYFKKMLLGQRKKQLESKKTISNADERPDFSSNDEDWTKEGRAMKEGLKKVVSNLTSKVFSKGKVKSKNSGFLSKIFRRGNNAMNQRDSDFGNNEFLNLTQSVQISNALNKIYPGQNINVYAVQDMYRTIGVQAFGYTIASQIYIDETLWNQDEVFMHEMSHIFYALNPDAPQVKAMLSYGMRNKKLLDEVLNNYDDEIQFQLANSEQDENGNFDKASKRDILGSLFDFMTEEEKNTFFDQQIKEGNLIEIPIGDQEVIMDELFAAVLQGPLSEKYDKFFNEKVVEEPKRRFLAKKFWGKVKEQGQNFANLNERKLFFDSLTPTEQKDFTDTRESLMNQFKESTQSTDVSAAGRASKIRTLNDNISSKLDSIDDEIKAEQTKLLNGALRTQYMNDNNINVEDLMDTVAFDQIFNVDRLQYANKLGFIVKKFAAVYNKGISVSNKLKGDKWKKLNYMDAERLRYHLIDIARTSQSGPDFIRQLSESEFDEVDKFMSWLDMDRDDKNIMLQTLWWHETNTSDITSFRTYVGPTGNASIELNLNNREITMVENIIDKVTKPFLPAERQNSADQMLAYNKLTTASRKIVTGNYTNQDLFDVFQYFTSPEMDIFSIWENNRVNISGKVVPLNLAVYNFVTSQNGLLGSFGKTEINGVPQFGLKDAKNQMKSSVRTFIKSVVNENRRYTANLTTVHADGNQHPSRIVDNYLTRNFKAMKSDAKRMNRTQFYERYGRINREGKGSRSNNLLDFMYSKLKNGNDVDIIEFGGIQNDFNEDKNVTLKENDSASDRLNQFLIYAKSAGKSSYLMDTGRYSDSTRAYYMEVPKMNTDDIVTFNKGRFVFSNKGSFNNLYNTHVALGYEGTVDDFKGLLENSVRENVEFIQSNLSVLKADNSVSNPISKLMDNNGKLTAEGMLKVANFELNNIMNGTNFTEIMFPSFRMNVSGENELVKRAKSGLSPMFAFPNIQLENIYVNDVTVNQGEDNEYKSTDSAFYILEKHGDKFRSAGGTIMPLGSSFKFLQTGVENYNENWKGKNIYNKGFATILNDEVIAKNPQLKGVYELLKKRDEKYNKNLTDQNLPLDSDNFLDGSTHHLPIIIAKSSNKNKLNGIPEDYDLELMDIDMLNDLAELGNLDAAELLLDKMYYQDSDFVGLSGENFGIQQIMDIDKNDVNSPIQFLKSLTTNMMVNGNKDEIIGVLNDIHTLSQNAIQETYDRILNGDEAEVRDIFKNMIDEDKVDQTQKDVLLNDGLSLKTPYLKQLVKNTFANYVKKNGLKLKTPGGILREKPTLNKKQYRTSSDMDAVSGNSDLAFYRKNSDGTFSPGEAVIPNRMLDGTKKKNPLFAREYFTEKSIEENLRSAQMEARRRNTTVGKVFSEDDEHIGYYAAGSSIMTTRIPSHGPQSTGFFEVVDFTGEEGNNIQLPNDYKRIIGSDNDGDQVFVQHKGIRTREWNSIFDRIQKHYMDPRTQIELNQAIDFEEDAENAISDSEKIYGKRDEKFVLPFSSNGREIAFKDTLISKGNVGIAADLHTSLRMIASYGAKLKKSITINGKETDSFFDSENESITINSAKLFNIILDNSKYGFADKLGINTSTINTAMVLTNLGFNLSDVSAVLNHPVTLEYAKLKNQSSGIFNTEEKQNIFDSISSNPKFKIGKTSALNGIVVDTSQDIAANNQSIFDLIRFVDNISSNEISAVGSLLSVHNTMTVNPFEIDQIIDNFNAVISNDEKLNLQINPEFGQNPIVQNYIDTLLKNKEIQQSVDSSFTAQTTEVYQDIVDLTTKTLSERDHKNMSRALDYFHASQLLGLNNVSKEEYQSLTEKDNPRNIFDQLKSHMDQLATTVVQKDETNVRLNRTALDNSLLFTKGLNFNFGGNNKYISINSEFHQNMIDEELRQQMITEFNQLPIELRNDLLLYDLMKNGWSGPQSLFPLFNQGLKMQISQNSKLNIQNSKGQLDLLRNRMIRNNPKMFAQYKNVMTFDQSGKSTLNTNLSQNHPFLVSMLEQGKPFIFRSQDKDGKIKLMKFTGFSDQQIANLQAERKTSGSIDFYNSLLREANDHIFIDKVGPSANANLDYISIPNISPTLSETNYAELQEIENRLKSGKVEKSTLRGRAMKNDWYNYAKTMSRNEFDEVVEYPKEFEENRKEENYRKYLDAKQKANSLKPLINETTVKTMSDENLLELYGSKVSLKSTLGNQFDDDKGLGYRDKFAYAEIMRPVVMEMIQRQAAEQSIALDAGAKKYGVTLKDDKKDIGVIQKWLMSNNIPSSHPGAQAVVKNMEIQYKTFLSEKTKYVTKINEATDNLYQDKFGYKVNERGIVDTIKHLYNQLFSDKQDFYNQLYGSLVVKENVTTATGEVVVNMRYKTEEEIQKGLKDGSISDAQYEFYKVTKEMTDAMLPFTGAQERQGYIPHTAPDMMEAFSRRGLLGVLVNGKTLNERIYDVTMTAKNPITGKMVNDVSFKQIEDWYNALSKSDSSFKNSAEFTKLKYKAVDLLSKGKNQNGTPIRYSNVELGTAIGDTFADSFSASRSIRSTDFPSMDLNKAFNDYIHSSLFTHGNDKFTGFKKMLPVVDGLLAQLDSADQKNMSEYIEKIWKNYFLQGSKQHNTKNLKVLEAVGISSDKVIDYMTKGSLIYWLGFKGLAIGGGVYAIGNVLVGKYKNIVNEGTGAWAKGEKRFWLGADGKFDIKNPFKGVIEANRILKNAGFMDINIFDDIGVEKKSGIEQTLMSLALMPMAKTERWIQGVHFLGKLSDEEWETLKTDEKLPAERMAVIEDDIKLSHGKGYQPTDQRMIQMYSWGRMMMQFSRWIPTNLYDKFAQEDINRFGDYYIGSYREVFKHIQKLVDGRWSVANFTSYRKNLPDAERRRLDAGLMGFGLSSLIIGANTFIDSKDMGKIVGDEHIFADLERMKQKLTPPAISMAQNFLR